MDVLDRALQDIDSVSAEDLEKLYDYDIFTLGEAASSLRVPKYGKKVFFNTNRHINPSNICSDVCKFCAFSASRKNPNAYEMSIDEIVYQGVKSFNNGALELHVVGAHNPNHSYEWYFDLFRAIKKAIPKVHLKAMGGAEVDFLHRKFGVSYEKALEDLANAGVDSMPGGGAEIFAPHVRKKICHGKVNGENWLKIHNIWHKMGHMSNATMLFGHIENRADRIDHMLRLRAIQQDEARVEAKEGGFNAFVPLLYQTHNNFLNIKAPPSGQEILKTIAISRIVLSNIPHIKAYWASLGLNLALVAQEFGADDMDGTIEKESIQSAAGAKSKQGVDELEMVAQIADAGFIPVQRDSLYNEVKTYSTAKPNFKAS
ncbi:aminofutalosine synthase MqnE [Helicobacter sp. 13S00401-1]|uniref:aminofutalosine synthase MqnE n=1 Tax=Helicobacter sp. 13S00401-1 TaxID=1905758 RepID=UPI000BA79F37|nr:aminofutalosine synthase MqnE [Helicobacter sp. 13S00401-1]PAF51845.1 aminofutalosine synthase MqnE [Helicobacter sp. 13S00401-1]